MAGLPETIPIDGSAANEAAIKRYNAEHGTAIEIRQIKYLNNIVWAAAEASGVYLPLVTFVENPDRVYAGF